MIDLTFSAEFHDETRETCHNANATLREYLAGADRYANQ